MTVYFKNQKWYSKFTIKGVTKHLLCAGARTKEQAENIEIGFKYRLQQQLNGVMPLEKKNVYFARLRVLYESHAKNNHKKYRNQVYYLNALEAYFNKGKPMNTIKPSDIEKFKTYLKTEKKLKNSSANRYLEIFSKMFNLAISNGELVENPVSKAGMLKEDNITIRFLTLEEEKRLFTSIDKLAPYLRPIVTVALKTGMRKGEILNLKWLNIKKDHIELLETKSGKVRKIPTSAVLDSLFSKLPRVSDYVFINPETKKPYTDIKKSWHKVLDDAHISNFRFHDLRHTVATRLVEKGVELLVIQEILGHSTLSMVQRYAHPVPERKKHAIDILCAYAEKCL